MQEYLKPLYLCKNIRSQTSKSIPAMFEVPLYLCKNIRFQTIHTFRCERILPLYLCKNIRFQTLKLQSPHGIPASSAPYLVLMQPLPVFPCNIYPLREGRQHALVFVDYIAVVSNPMCFLIISLSNFFFSLS